jgi:ubiquinone/menaquinone biosynthesis C-methylase UbiE/diadenosine tetraphosphate (Ap4A) HIT family hydrolase
LSSLNPSDQENVRRTVRVYDSLARDYANKWFNDSVMEETIREFASTQGPSAHVLDAGCGPGRDVKFMTDLGLDVVGVDLSKGMVQEARERCPGSIFRWMDFRTLRFPRDTFTGIWCCASVHHLKEDQAVSALNEFSRVLQENGLLGVSVETGENETERYDGIGRFGRIYTMSAFRSLLVQAGFAVLVERASENRKTTVANSSPKQWMYFLARKAKDFLPTSIQYDCNCPLCPEHRFDYAAMAGLPGPGSIIVGDNSFYLAPDVSPMVDGHLLLVSCQHAVSFGGLGDPFDEPIKEYSHFLGRLFKEVYDAPPLFFEHGGGSSGEAGACISHAHWHCVPGLAEDIVSEIKARFGNGSPADLDTLRSLRSTGSNYLYLRFHSGDGLVFPIKIVPSQFFRQVLARITGEEKWRWRSAFATFGSVTLHQRICARLLPVADALLMEPESKRIK